MTSIDSGIAELPAGLEPHEPSRTVNRRMALGIAYGGSAYEGWQSQVSGRTIQDHLEVALEKFAIHPVSTMCAGRTDAGVHALMQVVHFDTSRNRAEMSWVRGTNRFLPKDIAVQWAREVTTEFHARGCATGRRYAFIVLQSPVRPSVDAGRVGWVWRPLDHAAMEQAAAHLTGEHDFTSFRASACQARSPIKTLRSISISRKSRPSGVDPTHATAYWRFDFEGNAFLHHMIRNIMGCLLAVGQGLQTPQWVETVRDARSRDAAAPTFPADGLYFLGPMYEPHWQLPGHTAAFDWLP